MTLDDTNKAKIKDAITGEGAISALLTKSAWNGNKITLGFSSTLSASTTYRILMSEVTDIKGVTVKTFSPYEFTTFFHQGHGTEEDPFTIYTPAQLACLDLYPGQAYYYKQMDDLDLSGYANWDPIGSSSVSFRGQYNGYNKKISNAVINYPDDTRVGLFSNCSGSIFYDLTLDNISVYGSDDSGIFAGSFSNVQITNVNLLNSTLSGKEDAAGICGGGWSSSFSDVNISNINVIGTGYVGGVCGYIYYTHFTLKQRKEGSQ